MFNFRQLRQKVTPYIFFFLILGLTLSQGCSPEEKIDYNTQVKPILNAKCLGCHGGVRKQGGFSLLFEDEALATLKSGKKGIVPGKAHRSEMIRRLSIEDEDLRMPFEEEPLSEREIEILTKWVDQGAKWDKHWAYRTVREQIIPERTEWATTEIDAFLHSKMKERELTPSPKASPEILARRLALDLIGFPASTDIISKYLSSPTSENYESLVDTLLSSIHFGEKWATMWLDLARYADTKGYERDGHRSIWRFRDWLIEALNDDMPYDEFVTWQLAGDLFDSPSESQYVATAFHRNTMTNDEGGTNNEEFRTAAVIDRVNTTWEALMGTTFSCVQCHSHPYDPFTHKEYYEFLAFFNNTRDEDTHGDYPLFRHYSPEDLKEIESIEEWARVNVGEAKQKELTTFLKTLAPARNSLTADQLVNAQLADEKWLALRNNSSARMQNVALDNRTALHFRFVHQYRGGILSVHIDGPDGKQIGSIVLSENVKRGWQYAKVDIDEVDGTHDVFLLYENPKLKDPNKSGIMFDWMVFTEPFPGIDQEDGPKYQDKFWSLVQKPVETTPILVENKEELIRPTRIFHRGSWLDQKEEVTPAIPEVLNDWPEGAPSNRLGLAQWMFDIENPLASRTIVNRVWEQFFGTGIVLTLEDIGTQGTVPTNKELLDHLSWKLMHKDGWSLKSLIKDIVMSETYQQSSIVTEQHLEKDPLNEVLARMPRVRLSAEQIRDQALQISGSLNKKMYGEPVMPYQPQGIWSSPYDGGKWVNSTEEEQYRRAVYTYWKRTSPYPSMITFDGVGREVCTSRRIRTNTPLQALVVLNDSVYIDLSKKLALNVWSNDAEQMIESAYKAATAREISPAKKRILRELFDETYIKYQRQPIETQKLVKRSSTEDPAKLAAMIIVANSILNLDEVISKT